MSTLVPRTCTEVPTDGSPPSGKRESKPLSRFRSESAYVLLGDPGMGKTTEFERECEALGDSAALVSARDFIAFDPADHPEWRGKTLFIDGLDEVRTGSSDLRVPLDQVRRRLDKLGRPNFRLSCRAADWLGSNDAKHLGSVSPNAALTVLRLDPLDAIGIEGLLSDHEPGLYREARNRGLGPLLGNPMTLKLVASAVAHGEGSPESLMDTFEMACRQMYQERNEEHLIATQDTGQPPEIILDAAGYLCALMLIADSEGYSTAPDDSAHPFASLREITKLPEGIARDAMKLALASRLFTSDAQSRFTPVHRQVAEFLGGRFLAELIDNGLPVNRVLALMTSPRDERVVTALRGLSGWLAAHYPQACSQFIAADPVGVSLYGDISGFSSAEKRLLIDHLAMVAQGESLPDLQPSPWGDSSDEPSVAWAARALTSNDMIPTIREVLRDRGADTGSNRMAQFVLRSMAQADLSEMGPVLGMVPDIEAFLLDPSRPYQVREDALEAYLHLAPDSALRGRTLLKLLDELHEDAARDPNAQLRGTLLANLYPKFVTPSQVWSYATGPHPQNFFGRFAHFWHLGLLDRSTGVQMAELLDALHVSRDQLLPELASHGFRAIPVRILAKALENFDDTIETLRLYNWLSTAFGVRDFPRPDDKSENTIRAWLENHPHIQNEIFLAWLRNPWPAERFTTYEHWRCGALFRSKMPPDFGRWCLDRAVELADTEPNVAEQLFRQAYHSRGVPSMSEGVTIDGIEVIAKTHPRLLQVFVELREQDSKSDSTSTWKRKNDELMAKFREGERQRQKEWKDHLRLNLDDCHENRLSPQNLHFLATAYFGMLSGTEQLASPQERIAHLIGDHPDLVEAVLGTLRWSLARDDIPVVEETISLRQESKHSWLAYPVLASLEMLGEDEQDQLSTDQKRKALAIRYCVPPPDMHHQVPESNKPGWAHRWISEDTDLALGVLFQSAAADIRAGGQPWTELSDLERLTGCAEQVHEVRIRLLKAFPARGPKDQLGVLDYLLAKASTHPDKTALNTLISKKLSNKSMLVAQMVRWQAVGALLSPTLHRPQFKDYLDASQKRVQHLADFIRNISTGNTRSLRTLAEFSDPATLGDFIELLGRGRRPLVPGDGVVPSDGMSYRISELIDLLARMATDSARQVLDDLIANPHLGYWQDRLAYAAERQLIRQREVSYRPPSIKAAQDTLNNGAPANASDLAAMLVNKLADLGHKIRGGNSNLWRQFWNEEPSRRPEEPKHEESCRDALLGLLQERLPGGVDAAPEGRYAFDTRADIRVSYGGFNIPIEIKKKKNKHIELWNRIRDQLIAKYTTDPATSGHGIYLVLWFGPDEAQASPKGSRPATPEKLQEQLQETLTPAEAGKISVVVMDVSAPAQKVAGGGQDQAESNAAVEAPGRST